LNRRKTIVQNIQAKKESVWGFFKTLLQIEERAGETNVKEEPEEEEDTLKRMRKLELGCAKLNEEGLRHTIVALSKLVNLSHLSLDFSE